MIVSVHYKFIFQTSGEIAWAVKKVFCVYIDVELFGWTRTFGSKTVKKTEGPRPLFEVQMFKNCTPLWRKAHFQVKMHKT